MVVKYIFLSSILFFGLVGCTSITTMSSEQFNQLATTQLPFSGNWSGQVEDASAVLHLNRQGHGKLCIDNSKEVLSYRVKFVNDELYSDQGLKFGVKSINAAQANLHMRMLGLGVSFDLDKDDALNHVTPSCKSFINS
ncbi:J517_1871 family lipoprotein [Acinetobacter haemolyticus]|nr:J517_1871 family lipoprotein [Acinetobacter haemolyticus]